MRPGPLVSSTTSAADSFGTPVSRTIDVGWSKWLIPIQTLPRLTFNVRGAPREPLRCRTCPERASICDTVWSPALATQTDPAPTARCSG